MVDCLGNGVFLYAKGNTTKKYSGEFKIKVVETMRAEHLAFVLSQTAKMLWFIVLYLSVFVPDIPGKRKLSFRVGNLSAVRQRTESIGFSPLRGSHRAARRQKYHYSVMALSYGEAVIHLPSTYRSFPQWEIIAFVTDVAHHHRNVTEECLFNFQGAG